MIAEDVAFSPVPPVTTRPGQLLVASEGTVNLKRIEDPSKVTINGGAGAVTVSQVNFYQHTQGLTGPGELIVDTVSGNIKIEGIEFKGGKGSMKMTTKSGDVTLLLRKGSWKGMITVTDALKTPAVTQGNGVVLADPSRPGVTDVKVDCDADCFSYGTIEITSATGQVTISTVRLLNRHH